jgi:hypothetical protein
MSFRRAGPGPRVGAGRLRVDAARAIAKLRDYQLVDRTHWVLEAIRAAVASGATALRLTGDSNDVWLAWDGPAWPIDALPRLFDELVSPEPSRASQHLRLLATAVNSALGLDPAYVDVVAVDAGGAAHRVRYTPDAIAVSDAGALGDAAGDGSPLRRTAVEPIERPDEAPAGGGMLVHLRRSPGLAVLANLVVGPRELAVARAACRDLRVTIRIGGTPYGRDHHARDLLRVPLGENLDGFVALTDPDQTPAPQAEPTLEIAEHGVLLATYLTPLGMTGNLAGPVPLRLFVDGPRMPTNASRSEVRREDHPIAHAEARGRALLGSLLEQLLAALRPADGSEPPGRVRSAALALLAARIAGSTWASSAHSLLGAMAELGTLPLVKNAVGQRRAVRGSWIGGGVVHRGNEPFPVELAPWLEHVLWAPQGDAAQRLLGGQWIDDRVAKRHARRARRAHKARGKFLRHAPRTATVITRQEPLVRLPLGVAVPGSCIPDAVFAGMSGEVCLVGGHRGGLVVLLDGRELDELESAVALGFAAVIDNPKLTPAHHYRAAAPDHQLARTQRAAQLGAIRAAEALALARAGTRIAGAVVRPETDFAGDAETVRVAIGSATSAGHSIAESSPLAQAAVWPTVDGRMVSLVALAREPVIGLTSSTSAAGLPAGRVIVRAGAAERAVLAGWLAGHTIVVPYDLDVAVDEPADELAGRLATTCRPVLPIREPGLAGAIGLTSGSSKLQLFHAGVLLDTRVYHRALYPSVVIAVNADAIVPGAEWRGVTDDAGVATRSFLAWERALYVAIARALAGSAPGELIPDAPTTLESEAGRALADAIVAYDHPPDRLLGEDVVRALRVAPLVWQLGEPLRHRAIAAVVADLPADAAIPYVGPRTEPADGDGDFRPLLLDHDLAAAVGKLAGRAVRDATPELAQRRRRAARARKLAEHLARSSDAIELGGTTVPLAGAIGRGVVGASRGPRMVIDVHVGGRFFHREELADEPPVHAVVDVADHHLDDDLVQVLPDRRQALLAEIRAAAGHLVDKVLADTPALAVDDAGYRRLLSTWLAKVFPDDAVRTRIAAIAMFPTIQGERVAVGAATDERGVLIASWDRDWLRPGEREGAHLFDRPVLRVPAGDAGAELRGMIVALAGRPARDVGTAIQRLQMTRRVAHGLVAVPTLADTERAFTRKLADVGERLIGVGEIALVDADGATLHLFTDGEMTGTHAVDSLPAVRAAIEPADRHALGLTRLDPLPTAIRRATITLVRDVCRGEPPPELPVWLRRRLRHAILAGKLDANAVGKVPVLETTAGEWLPWSELEVQRKMHGDVWYAELGETARPLEDTRFALRLAPAEVAHASKHQLSDGTAALRLDDLARNNRARAPIATLDLPPDDAAACIGKAVKLAGNDGLTGWVVPLAPDQAWRRGVRAHRDRFPFEKVDDPCAWPTLAIVDDKQLAPDRTWSKPADDEAWKRVVDRVTRASVEALRAIGPRPADAVAAHWIQLEPPPRGPPRTGRLWLAGPPELDDTTWTAPQATGSVQIFAAGGYELVRPRGYPVGGWLVTTATKSQLHQLDLDDLFGTVYRAMLVDLRAQPDAPAAAAHLALGLATRQLKADGDSRARFACFEPGPIDEVALAELLHGTGPVAMVKPGTRSPTPALIVDDTPLSRVIRALIRGRGVWQTAHERARTAPAAKDPAPPEHPVVDTRHPLDGLATAVWARLVALGIDRTVHVSAVRIASGRTAPLARYVGGALELADHPRLGMLEAARVARSPHAAPAIDALAAHLVHVLNDALTAVTDGHERNALARLLEPARTDG